MYTSIDRRKLYSCKVYWGPTENLDGCDSTACCNHEFSAERDESCQDDVGDPVPGMNGIAYSNVTGG